MKDLGLKALTNRSSDIMFVSKYYNKLQLQSIS